MEGITVSEQKAFTHGYNAGYSQGQSDAKERENAELTRAKARIEELEKMIDLYRKANGQ